MEYITVANGATWKNDKKGNDKLPDYTGNIDFEHPSLAGKKTKIALWKRDDGFSLKITEIRDEGQ